MQTVGYFLVFATFPNTPQQTEVYVNADTVQTIDLEPAAQPMGAA